MSKELEYILMAAGVVACFHASTILGIAALIAFTVYCAIPD